MYSVSCWFSSSQKSNYFKQETRIELVFTVSKTELITSIIAVTLLIWLFGIIIYTSIVFRFESHKVWNQAISKRKRKLSLFFTVSKSESKTSPFAITLLIWLLGIIIYTCLVFPVDSHIVRNQAISKWKRELNLFSEFQKVNRNPVLLR